MIARSGFAMALALAGVALGLAPALAEEGGSSVRLELRYRAEGVEDDRFDRDALASTLRTTLQFESPTWRRWRAVVEAENVSVAGNDRLFNNAGAGPASNGVGDRPVVADVASTELNQAYLELDTERAHFRIGRQELLFGDQRFVGPVGWRQNHQSFDTVSVTVEPSPRTRVDYAVTARVHRIFADSQDLLAHLLNVAFESPSAGAVKGYAHLLDYDVPGGSPLSTATVGVEWTGERALASGRGLLYEVEWARQRDYGDNPSSIDADYHTVQAGLRFGDAVVLGGWERLGADPSNGAFRTPLATLHKFNGWADQFLATPTTGLDDFFVRFRSKLGGSALVVAIHDFGPVDQGEDFGQELDLQWTRPLGSALAFGAKAALFSGDGDRADVSKVMVWTRWRLTQEWNDE